MTDRKFYKTVIQITVLSEEPIPEELEVSDVIREMTDGGYSGFVHTISTEQLDGKGAALALSAQGSDPEFFQIDIDGNEVDA